MTYSVNRDPWMEHAKRIIFDVDAVNVSLEAKDKDLLKFGRNKLVGTAEATVQEQPTGILHESYVTSDLINRIVSTAVADTQTVRIEGHTVIANVFTFVTQTAILTGRTAVALTTPLARVSRVTNESATEMVGVISVTETDTYTLGVPDTPAKVHLQIDAGEQNSEKAATTISSADYWVITSFYADCLDKAAAASEIHLEVREPGGVFQVKMMKSASNNHQAEHKFTPYLIIYPNSDVRLTAKADGASTDVAGGIQGALLTA